MFQRANNVSRQNRRQISDDERCTCIYVLDTESSQAVGHATVGSLI